MLVAHARRGTMNFYVVGLTPAQMSKMSLTRPIKVCHESHPSLPEDVTFVVFSGESDQALVEQLAKVGLIDDAEQVRTSEKVTLPERTYPEGRVSPDDDGELQFRMGHDVRTGKIVMDWGKPVKWLAFGPDDAMKLVDGLREHAIALKPGLVPADRDALVDACQKVYIDIWNGHTGSPSHDGVRGVIAYLESIGWKAP